MDSLSFLLPIDNDAEYCLHGVDFFPLDIVDEVHITEGAGSDAGADKVLIENYFPAKFALPHNRLEYVMNLSLQFTLFQTSSKIKNR